MASDCIHKLLTLKAIVEELLMDNKATNITKEKISQLELAIMDIDDKQDGQSAHEWRLKLASYWVRYSQLLTGCSHFRSTPVKPNNIGRTMSSDFCISKNCQPNKTINLANDGKPFKIIPPTLETPLAYWTRSVNSLSLIQTLADINGIKKLIDQVSRALNLFKLEENPQLQSRLFNHAFAKLSPEIGEFFLAEYPGESLYGLFDFLRLEIESYTENHYQLKPNEGISLKQLDELEASSRDQRGYPTSNCKHCQESNHTIKDCPFVNLIFCIKCYRIGHKIQQCKKFSPFSVQHP